MELSQPRPCGAQGSKPTHDFLSLYSPAQQDPTPTIPGGYLKTHDFLQPLEQVGKNVGVEEGNNVDYIEKSYPPAQPTMVEHILPGGMGTCSINHISYMNQTQKVSKPEGIMISGAQSSSSNNNDENSNCSSYTGSGFTLWEDSNNVKKGKTRKENIAKASHKMRDGAMKIGMPWMASSMDNYPTTTFSSLSSSHLSSAPKNQCFADMVKSAKNVLEEEDNDEVFIIKEEPSSFHYKGSTSVSANVHQKPNSPRSKHSATEQRRRSKINDRFSMLRGIIPHGDQKRDKASFLLEVIEYIQFLQEKVHKYEDSYQGWTKEPPNAIPLNNKPTNSLMDQPQQPNTTFNTNRQNVLDSNTADKLKDEELIIENGTISISSIYSQGLSSALTQALKSSGVDLSQANISVKIDLGKRSNASQLDPSPPDLKEKESGEGLKRLKTGRK